jgi:hypothetical protein
LDINRLNTGEKVIGVSGILLFVFSFFNWLGISVSGSVLGRSFGTSASKSAWGFPLLLIAVLLGTAMAVLVILKAAGVDIPELGSVKWAHILLGVGVVVFVFIVLKLIIGPSNWNGVSIPDGIDKDRKIGIYLGLLASLGLVAGAYLNAKETGDLPGSLGGATGGPAPSPPPAPPAA